MIGRRVSFTYGPTGRPVTGVVIAANQRSLIIREDRVLDYVTLVPITEIHGLRDA